MRSAPKNLRRMPRGARSLRAFRVELASTPRAYTGTRVALRCAVVSGEHRLVDRLLRPFSKVHPGEGAVAALMLVCVFLLLSAYYVMKTAREGLILANGTWGLRGDEL